jgi:hypothetical protein
MKTNHRKNRNIIRTAILLTSLFFAFALSMGAANSSWEEEKNGRFEDPFAKVNTGESSGLRGGSIAPPDDPESDGPAAGEKAPVGDALGWLIFAGLAYGTIKKHSNFNLGIRNK